MKKACYTISKSSPVDCSITGPPGIVKRRI